MSTMIREIYQALKAAGVTDEQASAAAESVAPKSEVATKTDITELRGELTLLKWMVGVNTAGIVVIIGLILSLLRANP